MFRFSVFKQKQYHRFYSFREVLKALTKTRGLYDRWRVGEDGSEFRTPEEQEWTATELKNSLRSIEWDVEDLEDTIQVRPKTR